MRTRGTLPLVLLLLGVAAASTSAQANKPAKLTDAKFVLQYNGRLDTYGELTSWVSANPIVLPASLTPPGGVHKLPLAAIVDLTLQTYGYGHFAAPILFTNNSGVKVVSPTSGSDVTSKLLATTPPSGHIRYTLRADPPVTQDKRVKITVIWGSVTKTLYWNLKVWQPLQVTTTRPVGPAAPPTTTTTTTTTPPTTAPPPPPPTAATFGWLTAITTTTQGNLNQAISTPLGTGADPIAGNTIQQIVTNASVQVRADNRACQECHGTGSVQAGGWGGAPTATRESFCALVPDFNAATKPLILKTLFNNWANRNCPN